MFSCTLITAVLALSATVFGAPVQQEGDLLIQKLKMPGSALPKPDGLYLKYVALGVGTQNYTCTGDASAAPGSNGALATLYDIGKPLSRDPLAAWKIPVISGLALSFMDKESVLEGFLKISGYQKIIGEHFFNHAKTPTFAFSKVTISPYPQAFVKKDAAVDAPKTSCPGSKGEAAVPWLYLTDAGGSIGGVNTVYRVETAGGSPPKTCYGQPQSFEVPYVAQYWVYGTI